VFSRQGKGTGASVLRKKGSSNLTEDGSKEGYYLPLHLQVNRRIICGVQGSGFIMFNLTFVSIFFSK